MVTLPFPTREELQALAASSAGSFAQVPFAALLRALWEEQSSCSVEVKRQRLEKRIVFDRGTPITCDSNLAHERLGRFLVRVGHLTETDYAVSFAEAMQRETVIEDVLLARELITPEDLTRFRQQLLARQLLDGFSWSDGEFELRPLYGGGWSDLRIKVPRLIFTGTMRFMPQQDVDQIAMTVIGQRLVQHPFAKVQLADLRLNDDQRRFLSQIEQPRHLSDLTTASELDTDAVSRLICAFGILGVLVTEEQAEALEEAASSTQSFLAPTEAQAEATTSAAGAVVDASELAPVPSPAELTRTFFNHRHKAPAELLGVDATNAEPAEIDAAFFRFVERFSPWRFENEDSQGQARTVFLAGAKAYAQLAEEARKRSPLDKRKTQPIEVADGAAFGPPRVETDLLDPEVQYKEGHALFEQGDYRQALTRLELAADCDPQQGLYRAEAAYCRYLLDESQAEAAFTEMEEACRVDPTCGDAFLYAGELAGKLGRYEVAESRLRRANRILAPDRRAIDKLRELKTLQEGG